MHRQIQQEQPKTEILAALRMFDKQKRGYIPASELRAKLTKMGEKLTNKEGNTRAGTDQQAVKFWKVSPSRPGVGWGGGALKPDYIFWCGINSY